MRSFEWILCPVCQSKTRIRILPATVLKNFPLFYPKRKQKTLVNIK
ncbi:MAG TPA: cysteine-rich KTR domain-containing protein [Bacillota bacterium]|nr:cysteine-rich KTR domain-containing protein [Bacillota bacterium]HPA53584.1 cysteine-rich KTR domain-containing protein [Bacillota bacterium]HPX68091.1 cysteine-rich KTR domain-containing protein [Bacillota bacterium]HQA64467.1 cysteine-rich KTR domain-containing protein [Bacillota bacterium]HQO42622.1 cysteine-rich KTR domain-containing protein [Bacillota bacterium]